MTTTEHLEVGEGDLRTTVKYLQLGSTNVRYFSKGIEVNIGKYEDIPVTVHNARPNKDEFSLENGGFSLVQHNSKVTNFHSRQELDDVYSAEIVSLVQSLTGADDVILYSPPVLRETQAATGSTHQPRAVDVHTDWSPANAEHAARERRKGDASYSRFAFVNVWRALSPPPQDWPLAVVDARTVDVGEGIAYPMVIVDKIPDTLPMVPQPAYNIEGANFCYKPEHKWYYFKDMNIDEAIAFKLYDSDRYCGSQSWRCPHTAFLNPSKGTIPRESVEVRTVCYWK